MIASTSFAIDASARIAHPQALYPGAVDRESRARQQEAGKHVGLDPQGRAAKLIATADQHQAPDHERPLWVESGHRRRAGERTFVVTALSQKRSFPEGSPATINTAGTPAAPPPRPPRRARSGRRGRRGSRPDRRPILAAAGPR